MRAFVGILAIGLVWLVFPSSGAAHPLLDDGIERYERADFASALRMFNAAAEQADLSIDELVQLYEMRALLHQALGNRAAMLDDLERVVAVRPDHQLTRLAPPPVRAAFDDIAEMRGPGVGGQLLIEESVTKEAKLVVARTERVPAGLVDHTTVRCSVGLEGRRVSESAQGSRVELRLSLIEPHGGCEASALTKRGDVLFEAQLAATGVTPNRRDMLAGAPIEGRDKMSKKKRRWLLIAAGITVAVAGGITAGVVLSNRSNSNSEPGSVVVNW